MKTKAVFFDLDGTLVDSLPALHEGVRRLAVQLQLPDPGPKRVGDMVGAGVRVLVSRLLAWWHESAPQRSLPDVDQALTLLVDHWAAAGTASIRVFPGVTEGITSLRAAGVKIILVTNKVRDLTVALLEEKGITHLFDGLVTGSDCERLKPYPDMINRALELVKALPEEVYMVGDSRNDALAAREAGVTALLVETGYNEGVPLREWAHDNDFDRIYPDTAAACAAVLEENSVR